MHHCFASTTCRHTCSASWGNLASTAKIRHAFYLLATGVIETAYCTSEGLRPGVRTGVSASWQASHDSVTACVHKLHTVLKPMDYMTLTQYITLLSFSAAQICRPCQNERAKRSGAQSNRAEDVVFHLGKPTACLPSRRVSIAWTPGSSHPRLCWPLHSRSLGSS